MVFVFLLVNQTSVESIEAECITNADCIPAQRCHPTSCIPVSDKQDNSGTICTLDCAPGTLDCGQGSCICTNGKCGALIDSPLPSKKLS